MLYFIKKNKNYKCLIYIIYYNNKNNWIFPDLDVLINFLIQMRLFFLGNWIKFYPEIIFLKVILNNFPDTITVIKI